MIPRLFQMIKFQIELVAIATCIILNFYYLEEVWSLKITPKSYCFHFSDLITKRRNSHSIPNPQKVKVSIKFWKLQTVGSSNSWEDRYCETLYYVVYTESKTKEILRNTTKHIQRCTSCRNIVGTYNNTNTYKYTRFALQQRL